MYDGIPYWGKQTFENIETLKNKRSISFDLSISNLYDLFLYLSEQNYLVRIKEKDTYFYSYVRDICFNYRDKVIVLPYYSYDITYYEGKISDTKHVDYVGSKIVVRYNYSLKYLLIDDRLNNFRLSEIEVVNLENLNVYTISLENLKYCLFDNFSLKELSMRYLNCSYFFNISELEVEDVNRFHRIKNKGNYNTEARLRKLLSLPTYGLSTIDYGYLYYEDVRRYKYNDIKDISKDFYDLVLPYWKRRYLFESYLFLMFIENNSIVEPEYQLDLNNLGSCEKYRHYKVPCSKLPLYLKYYYKNNVLLRKKSYEKYVINNKGGKSNGIK